MAEGKKPGILIATGVIELVFSIGVFIIAISSMVVGCTQSVAGMAGAVPNAMTNEQAMTSAAAGAGVMIIITIVLSLMAIALGIIGIIGASNLFGGKKAGRSLSNFWAIALFVVFVIGLIPSIISIINVGSTAAGIQSIANSTDSSMSSMSTAESQVAAASMPVILIVMTGIGYLLPAILVFILLKAKSVKAFFAAA